MLVWLFLGLIFLIYFTAEYGWGTLSVVILIVILACLSIFSSLTIEIDEQFLFVRFGIGIIRKRFEMNEIESCEVIKNPWYYGWGIRRIPQGWLYRVSGPMAVKLKLKDGKVYRLGSDEPEKLSHAIESSLAVKT